VLGVTLTQEEIKALVATERQQDLHAASLLFSLFCLKAFPPLYLVALDTILYFVALALFCSFAFWRLLSRTMLA
jgi:hypothetical protein